ncbi:MAG: helix-turn-helix domain-containing protein [Planctomycetota bacterium]
MKIRSVKSHAHRRAFVVETARDCLEFPWSQAGCAPTSDDPVVTIAPDPELGNEAFTYRLASGAEGTVHLDHVLHFVGEPDYQRRQLLYALSCEAQDALAASDRSKRSIARQLGTSLAQVSRLFDPANTKKSLDQMVRLLTALGRRVNLHVEP